MDEDEDDEDDDDDESLDNLNIDKGKISWSNVMKCRWGHIDTANRAKWHRPCSS